MGHFFSLDWIGAHLAILGALWGVLKWAFHGIEAFKAQKKFVEDMATNHLPHIYESLTHISFKLGEEPKPVPPIKFIGSKED